ncbi:hypothetical protein ZWY2020_044468 [Hordeum vulgare]|nr:hypothetical protein ZWY2020_044468 [Hordeum vulgare]
MGGDTQPPSSPHSSLHCSPPRLFRPRDKDGPRPGLDASRRLRLTAIRPPWYTRQDHGLMRPKKGKLPQRNRRKNTKSRKGQERPSKNKKPVEPEAETKTKKHKGGESELDGKENATKEYTDFCKAIREHLSAENMRKILEANGQDASGSEDAVVSSCEDMMFYGPLEKCPICGGQLECKGWKYKCTGKYSEWASCIFSSNSPPRKSDPIKVPEDVSNGFFNKWLKRQEGKGYPKRDVDEEAHIFSGMMVALPGRMSRSHEQILNHGGQVNNSVLGVTCVVAFPAERDKGVSENWIVDSIQKKEAQPLAAYDIVSDVVPEGRGLPLDKLDPSEEAIMTLAAQLKLAGKRSVHKDSKLGKDGGCIFEKDDIIYNCACSICDLGSETNQLCIMQLIMLPEEHLHLFYKKGPIGHDQMAEERVEDFGIRVNDAIKEFARLFKEVTGNDFEPWEREKKFEKKSMKMYPLDMDVGFDVRHGGAALRQLGAAAAHCKLDPAISFLLKQLCGQEIYRYALTEMAQDLPDLPIGMLTDVHLKRDLSGMQVASGFGAIRDINGASHLIGDAFASTLDDPLSECYKKLGCSINSVPEDSEDYKMIVKYLEKTYEPVKVDDVVYGVSVDRIYAVESSAFPSYNEIKKLPNKVLLWCGTRSSNLLRHLHRGFLPAVCHLPVPGYMDVKSLEEKKPGVKGVGRKTTDESEHFTWRDGVKVPCGKLVPSGNEDGPLEYNEFAVYDPKQVSIQFLVGVRYEEQNMEVVPDE